MEDNWQGCLICNKAVHDTDCPALQRERDNYNLGFKAGLEAAARYVETHEVSCWVGTEKKYRYEIIESDEDEGKIFAVAIRNLNTKE